MHGSWGGALALDLEQMPLGVALVLLAEAEAEADAVGGEAPSGHRGPGALASLGVEHQLALGEGKGLAEVVVGKGLGTEVARELRCLCHVSPFGRRAGEWRPPKGPKAHFHHHHGTTSSG